MYERKMHHLNFLCLTEKIILELEISEFLFVRDLFRTCKEGTVQYTVLYAYCPALLKIIYHFMSANIGFLYLVLPFILQGTV